MRVCVCLCYLVISVHDSNDHKKLRKRQDPITDDSVNRFQI